MSRHEDKHCPRCNTTFECKSGSITQCQCFGIVVEVETQEWMSKQFAGCLCLNCIKALRTAWNTEQFTNQLKKHAGH